MEEIEITLDAEGIEEQLDQLKDECQVELDYESEANFDGALCCTIIGTTMNIGMFLMQAYSLWGDKRVSLKTKDIEVNELTIKKTIEYIEYLKSQNLAH